MGRPGDGCSPAWLRLSSSRSRARIARQVAARLGHRTRSRRPRRCTTGRSSRLLCWRGRSRRTLQEAKAVHDLRLRGTRHPRRGRATPFTWPNRRSSARQPRTGRRADPHDRWTGSSRGSRPIAWRRSSSADLMRAERHATRADAPSVAHARQLSGESTGAAARARRSAGVILASSPRRALARLGLVVNATALAAGHAQNTAGEVDLLVPFEEITETPAASRAKLQAERAGRAFDLLHGRGERWSRRNQARMHRIAKRTARHATSPQRRPTALPATPAQPAARHPAKSRPADAGLRRWAVKESNLQPWD